MKKKTKKNKKKKQENTNCLLPWLEFLLISLLLMTYQAILVEE